MFIGWDEGGVGIVHVFISPVGSVINSVSSIVQS